MAVTYGFYNSVGGDRRYDAVQMSALFDGVIEDGVLQHIGTAFLVSAAGSLNVSIGAGRAWFNHTWTLNDAALTLTATAASTVNPRYDAVVLEVNSSDAVRANTIKIVDGTPAASPVKPTMASTSTLHQYPLAYILRPKSSVSIVTGNIENVVGTAECPYATSRLQNSMSDPPPMHRMVFRGKNLGTSLTSDQLTAIQNGTFTDLWIGDYWVINGVTWRIADFDYWYYKVHPRVIGHHAVIMPDANIVTGKMNLTATTSGGYFGSYGRANGLVAAKTIAEAAFGSSRILATSQMLQVASTFYDGSSQWKACSVELPSSGMIYGYHPTRSASDSVTQLALCMIAPQYSIASGHDTSWLRDVSDSECFVAAGGQGDLAVTLWASDTCGMRPVFPIG